MTYYERGVEKFKLKYGYLVINNPFEYIFFYFFTIFGGISFFVEITAKLGFNLSVSCWYKYFICTFMSTFHWYYWRNIVKQSKSTPKEIEPRP